MPDQRHVVQAMYTARVGAGQSDDRDDVQGPGQLKLRCNVTGCLSHPFDLAGAPVAVLPHDSIADSHGTGPVLGVDDEDPRRPDRDVVDIGATPARPPDIVQHLVSVLP